MIKKSYQNEIIYEALKEHCIHPSAEALYLLIKPSHPNLSLATVYRNLNKMAHGGKIKKIRGLSSKDHFDHNIEEHYHMICEKCGSVFDIFTKMPPGFLKDLSYRTKHDILNYDITFWGICKNCKGEGE